MRIFNTAKQLGVKTNPFLKRQQRSYFSSEPGLLGVFTRDLLPLLNTGAIFTASAYTFFKHRKNISSKLTIAAKNNDIKFFQTMPFYIKVNAQDNLGNTALHYATRHGNFYVIAQLLYRNPSLDRVNNPGYTILHEAASAGHITAVEIFNHYNPEAIKKLINTKSKAGWTPLHSAIANGHINTAMKLIELGADIHPATSDTRDTALTLAVKNNSLLLTKVLLEKQAEPGAIDCYGNSIFHVAARYGFAGIFKIILRDIHTDTLYRLLNNTSKEERDNRNALHEACINGRVEIVNLILKHNNSTVNKRTIDGRTAFDLIRSVLCYKTLEEWKSLENYIAINNLLKAKSKGLLTQASTTLQLMLEETEKLEIVTINEHKLNNSQSNEITLNKQYESNFIKLLDQLEDLSEADQYGYTALHYAVKFNNPYLIELILDKASRKNKPIDLDFRGGSVGASCLYEACFIGALDVVKFLLEAGADLTLEKQIDNWTTLMVAVWTGRYELVEILLTHAEKYLPSKEDFSRYINTISFFEENVLHVAVDNFSSAPGYIDNMKILDLLLEKGVNVNVTRGQTSQNQKLTSIKKLTLTSSKTPLHLASIDGNLVVCMKLIEAGANLYASDDKLFTPLHYAALKGNIDIVKLLVSHGANIYATDKEGKMPIDFVDIQKHYDIKNYLVEVMERNYNDSSTKLSA